MFKLVHYKVCTASKWVVGILLECYLVLTLRSYAKSHSTRKHSSRMHIACLVTATGRRGGYPRSHAQRRGWVPTWTYPPLPWTYHPLPPPPAKGTWYQAYPQLRWRAVITKTLNNTYFRIKCVWISSERLVALWPGQALRHNYYTIM